VDGNQSGPLRNNDALALRPPTGQPAAMAALRREKPVAARIE
jgi:hypothetical protein